MLLCYWHGTLADTAHLHLAEQSASTSPSLNDRLRGQIHPSFRQASHLTTTLPCSSDLRLLPAVRSTLSRQDLCQLCWHECSSKAFFSASGDPAVAGGCNIEKIESISLSSSTVMTVSSSSSSDGATPQSGASHRQPRDRSRAVTHSVSDGRSGCAGGSAGSGA